MDFKVLKIFVQLVKSQSFTQAAEALSVTQPTISKALKQLEEEIGLPLFYKGDAGRKREVKLTDMGAQLYQHAIQILQQEQQIFEVADQIRGLKKGVLRLGLPPLGSVLLSSLIVKFYQLYPNIELSFLEVGATGIEEAILAKKIDVGILLGELKPSIQGIQIIDSPLCLLSNYDSQWRNRDVVQFAELKEESFLLYADTFTLNHVILNAAMNSGFEPKVLCKSSQWDFIAKMVESGVGIALLPQIYCEQLDRTKFSISLVQQPSLHWNLNMAWNATVAMNPATRAWLSIVDQYKDQIHF